MDWTKKTFKQLAERAAWRSHLKPKKKKKRNKAASSQAGGPAHKELEDHELQNIEFLENKEAEESGPKQG
jgi:hypothetical protein